MKKIMGLCSLIAFPLLLSAQDTTFAATGIDSITGKAYNTNPHPYRLASTVITNTFDGNFTGLQSTSSSGLPGAGPAFIIRGLATLTGTTSPMILLNGIPYYGNIAAINVQDVDSVTVLRTALETLPYGSRGANGVINIMTKNGSTAHHATLNVDARFGLVTRGVPDYDVIKSEKDYLETTYQLVSTLTNTPALYMNNVLGGYNPYNMPYTSLFTADGKIRPEASLLYHDDWTKALQRTGLKHDYNLSVNGRNSKGSYYLGAGYLKEQGYLRGSDFERFSATLNGDYKILPWLKAGANTQVAVGNRNLLAPFHSGIDVIRFMAPIYPVYYRNAAGEKETDPVTGGDKYDWGAVTESRESSMGVRGYGYNTNAAGEINLDQNTHRNVSMVLHPYLEATLLKQFIVRSALQYNISNNHSRQLANPYYGTAANLGGRQATADLNNYTYTFNQSLTWQPGYWQDHHLAVTATHENFNTRSKSDYLAIINVQSAAPVKESSQHDESEFQYESFRAVASYDYRSKYFISGGFNRDQNSVNNPSLRWKNNWAAGAGYMLSEESFLNGSRMVNTLKLRLDYGIQNFVENGFISAQPDRFKQGNAGFDFSGLKNRLQIRMDVYSRTHKELFYATPTPPVGGFVEHFIVIRNSGIEASITGIIVQQKTFSWTATLNLAHNKNKIVSFDGLDTVLYGNGFIQRKGGALYDFFMPEYAGADPQNGRSLFNTAGNGKVYSYDSARFLENRVYGGSIAPKVFGSLTQVFAYKNFDLSVRLNFALGGKVYDNTYASLMASDNGYLGMNWSADILNSWTPENRNTDIPVLDFSERQNGVSTRFLTSASYLNIKNVYLAYNIPAESIRKAKMKSLSIYITADNLWLFSARKGLDPQANFYGTGESSYPAARTIMMGVHVGL